MHGLCLCRTLSTNTLLLHSVDGTPLLVSVVGLKILILLVSVDIDTKNYQTNRLKPDTIYSLIINNNQKALIKTQSKITSKIRTNYQMTRKLLVVAFILFCLNKINGQKIYEKDPGFLGSLGGDQVPSNGQEYSNDRVNVFT